MKKKIIISIIAVACVCLIVGFGIAISQSKQKAANKKQQTNVVKTVNKEDKAAATKKTQESNNVQNPNAVPEYIQEIEEVNHDTDYWWDTSMSNIIQELQKWNDKYHSKDIETILNNQNQIPSYLVRLAVMHPESIPYVAGYPTKKMNQPINIENYYKKGQIPLFQQWDKQWGYDWYGNGPIATDGCGPTSLSMIIVGLTGNLEANPRAVADYSANNGGYTWNQGSNVNLMLSVAEHFGITPHKVNPDDIIQQLKMGRPIIVSCHAGAFTLSGHIIVLSGIAQNGQIEIKDPDSVKLSNETWPVSTIINNMNYAFSYTVTK